MNEKELGVILDKHQKWLNKEPGGERADFSGLDLTGVDFSRTNLYRANFSGANLPRAKFSGADLIRANFSGANLTRADLYRAKFSGAKFSGADLTRADLTEANLFRADLTGVNLTGAKLTGTKLTGAKLTGTNLADAKLFNTIGNGKEITTIISDDYIVNFTDKILQIGCQQYPIDDWFKFTDKEIYEMDDKNGEKALNSWKKWKPILQMILE